MVVDLLSGGFYKRFLLLSSWSQRISNNNTHFTEL